jgi:Rrf2 family protein
MKRFDSIQEKMIVIESQLNICYYLVQNIGGLSMKISTKGRYALRMLLDLAEYQNDAYVSLKDIAKRQDISKKYLEQIVSIFSKTNILLTNRGSQGGYRLAQSPDKYTVGQILRLTEGSLSPVSCLDQDPIQCERSGECLTLPVWQGLNRVINEYLDGITLQDLLDNQKERYANDYVI